VSAFRVRGVGLLAHGFRPLPTQKLFDGEDRRIYGGDILVGAFLLAHVPVHAQRLHCSGKSLIQVVVIVEVRLRWIAVSHRQQENTEGFRSRFRVGISSADAGARAFGRRILESDVAGVESVKAPSSVSSLLDAASLDRRGWARWSTDIDLVGGGVYLVEIDATPDFTAPACAD
jgi:hypothetical protein